MWIFNVFFFFLKNYEFFSLHRWRRNVFSFRNNFTRKTVSKIGGKGCNEENKRFVFEIFIKHNGIKIEKKTYVTRQYFLFGKKFLSSKFLRFQFNFLQKIFIYAKYFFAYRQFTSGRCKRRCHIEIQMYGVGQDTTSVYVIGERSGQVVVFVGKFSSRCFVYSIQSPASDDYCDRT